jgi:integrating conjugative element protein (TIGR03757 family)
MRIISYLRAIGYLALCAVMVFIPAQAGQEIVVEAIHSDAFPLTGVDDLAGQGIEVKTYNLDDGKRWTTKLATGLPPNQEQAKAEIERRFNQQGTAAVQNQIMQAFQARIAGMQYGLSRYPAIVFDRGRAVVYGVTDLNRAFELYREWRRKNP